MLILEPSPHQLRSSVGTKAISEKPRTTLQVFGVVEAQTHS